MPIGIIEIKRITDVIKIKKNLNLTKGLIYCKNITKNLNNFLLKKSNEEIDQELEQIKKIMHFPSRNIAESLNMKVETPFMDEEVIKFSNSIPISRKINVKEDK